jgi:Gas vesicle protein K
MIMTRPTPNRLATDDETAADDLVRLVLALVETLRQLVERQAIHRVEGGHLADDEVERLGLALLRLEQRIILVCRTRISPCDSTWETCPISRCRKAKVSIERTA